MLEVKDLPRIAVSGISYLRVQGPGPSPCAGAYGGVKLPFARQLTQKFSIANFKQKHHFHVS